MRVGILGSLEVTAAGDQVRVGGARLRALLARLAVDVGRPVSVEVLADALWPEQEPADPAHAVQALVSRLRRALAGVAVRQAGGGYLLDLPADAVDAVRFEHLAREGRQALDAGDATAADRVLTEALALWRGPALADVPDAPYAAATTARLAELRLAATEDRVAAQLACATGSAAVVAELEALIAAHPLRERSRALLVRVLHAQGRQAEALRAYEDARRLLADELGVDPGPDLRAAHLEVLTREPDARRGGNLPAPLTSFVGREAERARLTAQLREARLVTLTGPGGAGKSRLATTVGAALTDTLPGGVWLVELAPVGDPDELVRAVADAVGVRVAPAGPGRSRDAVGRLADALPSVETLLVLDNCEHLVDAAARLADELLGRCPRLRVLATSREPLGIVGEVLSPVPPLDLPAPDATPADAESTAAVRLFVERARAVQPGFTLTGDDVGAVTEICRRLDGLPLAIELAAARSRHLPVNQLAARLDERFQLLTGGSRTALPRHRTLRAVVAWSWDLLSPAERRFAEQAAVFPAAFTPAAAARVCGAPREVLDALVDRSLLAMVDRSAPRYRMLETVREYGLERLAGTGRLAAARSAHAAYFLERAEEAAPRLRGFDQLPWLRSLAGDRDDLLAAWRFACEDGDTATAVRLAAALGYFWMLRDGHVQTASRLQATLGLPGEAPLSARSATAAGYLVNAVLSGDVQDARPLAPYLREIARARGGDADAVLVTALVALLDDDYEAGLAAIDDHQPDPDPWRRAMLWLTRSFLSGNRGDPLGMRRDVTAAAAAFRKAGERWGLVTSLGILAFADVAMGDFAAAVTALEKSLGIARELGADDDQRIWLAMVRVHTGDLDTAHAELTSLIRRDGPAGHLAMARLLLADLARHAGDPDGAAHNLDLALAARADTEDGSFGVLRRVTTAQLAAARGEHAPARAELRDAFVLARTTTDMPMVAVVVVAVAEVASRAGAPAAAAELLGAAAGLRGFADAAHPDVARLTGTLLGDLGEHAYRRAYERGRGLVRTAALALVEAALDEHADAPLTTPRP